MKKATIQKWIYQTVSPFGLGFLAQEPKPYLGTSFEEFYFEPLSTWVPVSQFDENLIQRDFNFQDGGTLNIDFEDPLLKNVKIPSDFLNKTYIGRCPYDFKGGCSNPGGMLSDFNIWDRALTEEQMKSWTTCKWALMILILHFLPSIVASMNKGAP